MKRLAPIFFFAIFFGLMSTNVFTQISNRDLFEYLPDSENYKEVLKYKEPIERLTVGWGYYGDATISSSSSGLHLCSINRYYKTGEPLLAGTVISQKLDCSNWDFHGQVVYYYKNGNSNRKGSWKAGKLDGVLIYYFPNGNERLREEYVEGKLIDESKFSVSTDNPIIGTWKYVEYSHNGYVIGAMKIPPSVKKSITLVYSQNGVVESTIYNGLSTSKGKGNWKYISKDTSSGVLEEYQGTN